MKEVQIDLGHISLSAYAFGDSNKPLLLALHGWLDNAASFIPLAQVLQDYHVLAIEWPGHGHSKHRPASTNYQLTDYVYDLYALTEYIEQHFNLTKFNVVAHSLGGIVASIFSGLFAEKINKLVLIEALGPIVSTPQETAKTLRKSIVMQYRNQGKAKPIHASKESAIKARMNVSDFDEPIAKLLVERSLMETEGGVTWRSDQRLRNLSPLKMTEQQAQDILSKISMPTLLIVGSHGLKTSTFTIPHRKELVKQLTVENVDGGHHVHMEQPARVGELINGFFSAV